MYIGSIDPAVKNLGFVVYDSETEQFIHLGKSNLLLMSATEKEIQYKRSVIPRVCVSWVSDHSTLLSKCDFVIIEGQMLNKHIQISLVLEALIESQFCKALILHPTTVKTYFKTRKHNYTLNKKASVAKCQEILSKEEWSKVLYFPEKKRDDVCDSILQAIYTADHFELARQKHDDVCAVAKTRKTTKKKTKQKKNLTTTTSAIRGKCKKRKRVS